jgi:hypothetical protein
MSRRTVVRTAIGVILSAVAVEALVIIWWVAANWQNVDFAVSWR